MDLGLRADDRVLVFGASGWFGRELRALVALADQVPNLLWVPGPSTGAVPDDSQVEDFRPSVVVNFAALTRERVEAEGEEAFTATTQHLASRFHRHAQASSVRLAVTVSSGAAVTDTDHAYGRLKAAEERMALQLGDTRRTVVVIRAYSVSGGYVRRPRHYAFSDLILQAAQGHVHVSADSLVYRRYCSVRDVLTVALRSGANGRSGLFETGGSHVEMGELADAIVASINPRATVARSWRGGSVPHSYCSDNTSWLEWTNAAGVRTTELDEQITQAAEILLAS